MILGLFKQFLMVCINFSPALQGMGGWKKGRGGWDGGGEDPELPTDGPDNTTRPKGHHSVEFQADNTSRHAQRVSHGFTRL